jgi:16S rRNA (guanine966-N2)-methyltransferase
MARGMKLVAPPPGLTRPTTDRLKETVFNMLAPRIEGAVMLDLFAGSGQIGIEALSRGAKTAVFVERHPSAAAVIRRNLAHTKLAHLAQVFQGDCMRVLPKLAQQTFDLIFIDPPYGARLLGPVMDILRQTAILASSGVAVAEVAYGTTFSSPLGLEVFCTKSTKTTTFIFIRKV